MRLSCLLLGTAATGGLALFPKARILAPGVSKNPAGINVLLGDCPTGWVACGSGCMPIGGDCCGDTTHCEAGDYCDTLGCCPVCASFL